MEKCYFDDILRSSRWREFFLDKLNIHRGSIERKTIHSINRISTIITIDLKNVASNIVTTYVFHE